VNFLAWARHALNFDTDALAEYRGRIGMQLSGAGVLVLLPFVVLHVLNSRWSLALVNVVLVSMLGTNSWALKQGRKPPTPFWILGAALVLGVSVSVMQQGMLGVPWTYPALFVCFFLLPRRVALLLSVALLLGVGYGTFTTVGADIGWRVVLSLLLTLFMINVVLNVIGELQAALVLQAITDPLTGAYNRRHMQVHLDRLVVPKDASPPMDALLVIDIDHFKQINDSFGHDVGDEVLRKLVSTVSAGKRRSDLLFRTGGEEFLLLLPRVSQDTAMRLADELRLRLVCADLLPGANVTVSIGVSALQAGQTAEAWVKSADLALYEAKHAGRNCVALARKAVARV
jgi:diguanylate cyclase (GGDEF)-like protein